MPEQKIAFAQRERFIKITTRYNSSGEALFAQNPADKTYLVY